MERLTDRHEALAQSVELMGHRIEAIITAIDKDAENILRSRASQKPTSIGSKISKAIINTLPARPR